MKDELGFGFSDNIALYVIAAEEGIDVFSYLSPEEIEEYREAVKIRPRVIERIAPSKPTQSVKVIKMPNYPDIKCPNLPEKVFSDARKMSEVYYQLYLFENSLRYFIIETLETKYGKNWWKSQVSTGIKENAESREKKEGKNRWYTKRGVHPIFYIDIDDLRKIITQNHSDFKNKLPEDELKWLEIRIKEIKDLRNIVAHHNPLEEDGITQIKLNFKQWINQIS